MSLIPKAFGEYAPLPAGARQPADVKEPAHPQTDASKPGETCELLSRGPGVDLTGSEVTLHTQLESLLNDLRNDRYETFAKYFHPRAKVKRDIGDKLSSIIKSRYDGPLQFSVFRVWRLRSQSAGKTILDNCPEADGARIIGAYGYEKQYAVWIQIMGQNELGRLIFSIAPNDGKDLIAGFRIQQWTQSGDDWKAWVAKGEQAESSKNLREAYFAYDIAQKLMDGKDLVVYPLQAAIVQKRDGLFTQKNLVAAMNQELKVKSIAYVGTLLAKEGSGLFIRDSIKSERPMAELHDRCLSRGQALKNLGWLKEDQGIRCNFIFKGMDPRQDSQIGGFYFTAEDLRRPKK